MHTYNRNYVCYITTTTRAVGHNNNMVGAFYTQYIWVLGFVAYNTMEWTNKEFDGRMGYRIFIIAHI